MRSAPSSWRGPPTAAARGPRADLRATAASTRGQCEGLVKAGAFDCLDPNRAQSFAAADLLLRHASRTAEERESRQENLFAGIAGLAHGGVAARPSLPVVADWPPVE